MNNDLRPLRHPKGEGFLPNLLLLLALGGLAYGVWFYFMKKPVPPASTAAPGALERTNTDARPGSPAGAAAQQAQEMGNVAAQ